MSSSEENRFTVWVFVGAGASFPSAVFADFEGADTWICKHRLTGVLTEYPLNTGIYEWAIERGAFTPKKDEHTQPAFIARFTSASQEHFHYENGARP
jgi:hypothetical protein